VHLHYLVCSYSALSMVDEDAAGSIEGYRALSAPARVDEVHSATPAFCHFC
jgi:hypothetical protein